QEITVSLVKEFKFIKWEEFGEVVEENRVVEPSVSLRRYAELNRYDVKNRLPSAVKELLTLAKLYDIPYNNSSSPVTFSYAIIDAIFTTIIVSAAERDMILNAQLETATHSQLVEAEQFISELRLPEIR
ncbi:hypothetical protein ACLMT4_004610, partial [Vibrio parahaemolyticus]